MRLDKWLTQSLGLTRSEAKKLIKSGQVSAFGSTTKDPGLHVDESANVCVGSTETEAPMGLVYLVLYKPAGYECTLREKRYPIVPHLIDLPNVHELRMAGRLDVDTTGVLLLTNDGQWLHKVTSPKKQCEKVYVLSLSMPLDEQQQAAAVALCAKGMLLEDEDKPTKPAKLEFVSETCARLTLVEGKYHQVKRMALAFGSEVAELHRESVGMIDLTDLEPGECRFLTEAEIQSFG